jgi:hypothetical protein
MSSIRPPDRARERLMGEDPVALQAFGHVLGASSARVRQHEERTRSKLHGFRGTSAPAMGRSAGGPRTWAVLAWLARQGP